MYDDTRRPGLARISLEVLPDRLTILNTDAIWHEHPPRTTAHPCPQVTLLRAGIEQSVIGARIDEPHGMTPEALRVLERDEQPRFTVPQLALVHAPLAQVITAVQRHYLPGEITAADEHQLYALEAWIDGRNPDAEYHWRRALEAGDLAAHRHLGRLALDQADWHAAERHLGYFTALDPSHPFAWWDLAVAYEQLGDPASAFPARTRAALLDPDGPAGRACTRLTGVVSPTWPSGSG